MKYVFFPFDLTVNLFMMKYFLHGRALRDLFVSQIGVHLVKD